VTSAHLQRIYWIAYLNLLLEILDVVDSQIQHVRCVGLLQEMEVKVADKSILEWSSHRKFANHTHNVHVLLPIGLPWLQNVEYLVHVWHEFLQLSDSLTDLCSPHLGTTDQHISQSLSCRLEI
jgi:hypothetical protein